jgi:hypothetical protein
MACQASTGQRLTIYQSKRVKVKLQGLPSRSQSQNIILCLFFLITFNLFYSDFEVSIADLALLRCQPWLSTPPDGRGMRITPCAGCTGAPGRESGPKRLIMRKSQIPGPGGSKSQILSFPLLIRRCCVANHGCPLRQVVEACESHRVQAVREHQGANRRPTG